MKRFKGLTWFLLFFILFEAFIFRNPSLYGLIPKSFIGQIIDLEKRFNGQDKEQIEWIILGDSQAMDGVRPPFIANELGIEPDRIFNLSISGGKPVNELRLLQKILPQLKEVKGALIIVSEHQFNNTGINKDTKFRYDANLKERLVVSNVSEKADLLLGWISYGYGLRDVWWEIGKKHWKKELPVTMQEPYNYPWGLDPVSWSPREYKTEAYATETAERWLKDFELEGPHTMAFLETIDILNENKIPWVVIQLPRMEILEKAIKRDYSQEQKAYLEFITKTTESFNKDFITDFPHLPDDSYRDINHVNEKGAKLIAPKLAEIIDNLR